MGACPAHNLGAAVGGLALCGGCQNPFTSRRTDATDRTSGLTVVPCPSIQMFCLVPLAEKADSAARGRQHSTARAETGDSGERVKQRQLQRGRRGGGGHHLRRRRRRRSHVAPLSPSLSPYSPLRGLSSPAALNPNIVREVK